MVGALAGMSFYVQDRIGDYLDHDVTTKYRRHDYNSSGQDLPFITICNENQFFFNSKALEKTTEEYLENINHHDFFPGAHGITFLEIQRKSELLIY